ncbi:MAG: APC family permease [Pseudomonadota bacterium]|nr:APC family permease [Pseudomonadota bacterium]
MERSGMQSEGGVITPDYGMGDEAAVPGSKVLHRKIDWTGAFWVASGVPALVLFSIGSVAATVGRPSWMVWTASILLGFIQSFTYAEIAGLFPNKSGGASVYGAVAWVRYSKLIAPVSVWCNWLAWSPVLALGSGLAAGFVLSTLFSPDSAINAWQLTLLDLGFLKGGLTLRINSVFLLGAAILVSTFAIQHGGILRSARTTMVLGVIALVPLIAIALVPVFTGSLPHTNFFPLVPIARDAQGVISEGHWDMAGITVLMGGMFMAAWSTYGFETAVCYTREFRDPKNDTFKAIFYSGLLCLFVFSFLPLAFQAHLGLGHLVTPAQLDAKGQVVAQAVYDGMLAPDIYSGTGVAKVLSEMIRGGAVVGHVVIAMLVLALALSIMTSMAGSSRTLYQASVDGWLPRYLSHVNEHGAPTHAMWTDLCFNLILLTMSDYVFVLAASNVCYLLFNFLNLNAGWIHRIDRPNVERPFRAPTWVIAVGGLLSFVNLAFMGIGADIWGPNTLLTGVVLAALIVPVFWYRHYFQDRGVFPEDMLEDMHLTPGEATEKRAGFLPYLALLAGVAVVFVGWRIAVY